MLNTNECRVCPICWTCSFEPCEQAECDYCKAGVLHLGLHVRCLSCWQHAELLRLHGEMLAMDENRNFFKSVIAAVRKHAIIGRAALSYSWWQCRFCLASWKAFEAEWHVAHCPLAETIPDDQAKSPVSALRSDGGAVSNHEPLPVL